MRHAAQLIDPPHAPGYWKYETSGIVKAAVGRYLLGVPLLPGEIGVMREYCRQWIASPIWDHWPRGDGEWLAVLRDGVDGITSAEALDVWLGIAGDAGCDPL